MTTYDTTLEEGIRELDDFIGWSENYQLELSDTAKELEDYFRTFAQKIRRAVEEERKV